MADSYYDIESDLQYTEKRKRKRSLLLSRGWNSLTRCQKNTFYMLLLFALIAISFFFFPTFANQNTELMDITEINELFTEHQTKLNNQVETLSKLHDSTTEVPTSRQISQTPLTERQKAVVSAMKHAWRGYVEFAWGRDMLKPISRSHQEWFGLGLTIIDAIDTLYIMNLTSDYEKAKHWVQYSLDFDKNVEVNLFETTIRILGGLLSIYHLSGEQVFLDKARILGDKLMPAFNTPSGIPRSDVNLHTGVASDPKWDRHSSVSEVTSIQLEFKYLSYLTGNKMYSDAVERVMMQVQSLPKTDFLVPQFISADSGNFKPGAGTLTMGSRADSYYEYLLKQWLLTGKSDDRYQSWYLQTVEGVVKQLLRYSEPNKLAFLGEVVNNNFSPKMDHLACYYPGTLALGFYHGLSKSHLRVAKELMDTCYQMYARTETKLSPEIAYFNLEAGGHEDISIKDLDAHNLLRPETVESLFYMYRITRMNKYRDWGWEIFQAFEKYCRIETGGYSSINNVRSNSNPHHKDMMETFFLGETLKYLFLLFSDGDSSIWLNSVVFNTEAHLIPVLKDFSLL